jgi:hypothetical protein
MLPGMLRAPLVLVTREITSAKRDKVKKKYVARWGSYLDGLQVQNVTSILLC